MLPQMPLQFVLLIRSPQIKTLANRAFFWILDRLHPSTASLS